MALQSPPGPRGLRGCNTGEHSSRRSRRSQESSCCRSARLRFHRTIRQSCVFSRLHACTYLAKLNLGPGCVISSTWTTAAISARSQSMRNAGWRHWHESVQALMASGCFSCYLICILASSQIPPQRDIESVSPPAQLTPVRRCSDEAFPSCPWASHSGRGAIPSSTRFWPGLLVAIRW